MKTQATRISTLALAVALAAGGGFALVRDGVGRAHAEPAPAASMAAPIPGSGPAMIAMPDFRSIVARYGPAVVNISVEGTVKTSARNSTPFGNADPSDPNDPLSQFFRRFGPQFQMPEGERPSRGQGSGFIVSEDGIILTNAHVIADAETVKVKLTDKREFTATVVGLDKPTDVAVLKIEADNLPTVPLGNPASASVGDWVLAIGAPFGFENSVTAGIISAKSRSLPSEGYVPFIQTDVAINPGNSGGPLLNLNGEVVGINSQIYSRSGGYQGLSFAIPIDVAAQIKNQLIEHGRVSRSRIGVAIQGVNQELALSFGLDKPSGALISNVEKDSPAARAGLEAGDVILELNGEPIAESADLPPRVAALKPGSEARLAVWRKGERQNVNVTVEERDAQLAAADAGQAAEPGRLGVAVRPLTADEQKQLASAGGLLVLESGGAAARAGIREGDLILSLNGKPIENVDQLKDLVRDAGKHVAILVQRKDARIFIPIELG
nr:DegQ family serine endoprotease [Zoogloeaceae bacterium]